MSPTGINPNSISRVANTAGQIQKSADKIAKDAATPSVPGTYSKPKSAAALEEAGFMDRSLENSGGGVSAYTPSDGGLKLKLGASAANVPFVDIFEGAQELNKKSDNPLNNRLARDYDPSAGVKAEVRFDIERWSLGVKVDGSASLETANVAKTAKDASGLFDQAKALESKLSGLQQQVTDIGSKLQNSQGFRQAEELLNKISKNPTLANQQTLSQLKNILSNGELPKLFSDLQSTLDNVNSAMNDTNTALGMIGDKTRSITADVAVRGTAEINGAYRTERHDLGKGWGIKGGVEAAVIVPLPNPVKMQNDNGFPQFKYAMAKASTYAQVTTSGLENLRDRISSLQSNLSDLQGAVDKTGKANNQANKIADKISPNNPTSVVGQIGPIKDTINKLSDAADQAAKSAKGFDKNIQGLSEDLNKVKVQTSVGVTTVTPTAPVGFGIKDIGATVDGPLGKNVKMSFSAGIMNPIGYLQGEKSNYALVKDNDKYKLNLVSTQKGNVFHDFYDPTLYGAAGVKFNDGKWYKTQVDARVEKSLTSDTVRVAGIARQSIGPVSLRGGVMDSDIKNGGKNLTYMGGLGIGSIKNPDIFSVNAAVDSPDPQKMNNASVQAQIKIPF